MRVENWMRQELRCALQRLRDSSAAALRPFERRRVLSGDLGEDLDNLPRVVFRNGFVERDADAVTAEMEVDATNLSGQPHCRLVRAVDPQRIEVRAIGRRET